jgi:hypothetical protein
MKIGVYGDSFADYQLSAKTFHWSTIVETKLNAVVTNFGYGSSSMFHSYKEFLKNYTEHDLIIFAVTHPDRYTKRFDWCDKPRTIISNGYISNYETVIDFKEKATNEQDKKMLTHLEGWYIMSNGLYNADMHELMLQHMESLHKNIIFYPCFDISFLPLRYSQSNFPASCDMYSLLKRQMKLLNYSGNIDTPKENKKVIAGHLVPEMNEYVAEAMITKILTGDWKFSNLDNIKLKNPVSYYYN